ncbi:STT3 domain-containing protein [Sulfurovum sp.]|uniref:STT3 domain-containing protein n=1 Tax=Sulfurovum sp. TaxID=1969726 RepID=UPI002867C8BE|nr:STT3 domain-containing protein [Sulfurovum sp.]
MIKENLTKNNIKVLLLFMLLAYLFSIGVRLYWPMYFADNASMFYAGQLMINTNDGYYFATGARDILDGVVAVDKQRASAFGVSQGMVMLTVYAAKLLPFSFETIILYMPAVISSLIVIPVILTGCLMGHTSLGFFAALLGSVSLSYYNRTMVGYYDTDMFSVLLQFTIFYSFLYVAYKKEIRGVVFAALLMFAYPFFYPQGMTIIYAMFIMLAFYLILEHRRIIVVAETDEFKEGFFASPYNSVILLSIPLMLGLPMMVRAVLFLLAFALLFKMKLKEKQLFYTALAFFAGFLFFGNVFSVILTNVLGYLSRGVESEGLHFYQVIQTVREAGAISFEMMAERISGSQAGMIAGLIGYLVLVMRHKPFVIALPLIGVGVLSLWAGLRFTVYAVPVAAISAIYLFYVIANTFFKDSKLKYAFIVVATVAMLYPNITHIIDYKVPTVLNETEANDLAKLDQMANAKDYTLAWWDYGYPIWYYSNTNTLIDGGKHNNDNFIISKIMQTTSQDLVANLSRLAVETYVDSNYTEVADTLFKNGKKDQLEPSILLSELEDPAYALPAKTRDIYIYLPSRMLSIFPTVAIFGNLDLTTGKEERKISFYPAHAVSSQNGLITLDNGIQFDAQKGEITLGEQKKSVKYFVVTQNTEQNITQSQSQLYQADGEYTVVYMKSYGQFIVMDNETFNSAYVQMFMLEKYDKNLFELVVSSPYSKIYKLKK